MRICPVCGTEFAPRTHNHRYCTGYRGQCYRRAMNVAYRGGNLTAPLPKRFECAQCGKRVAPRINAAANAVKFCGKRCKAAWHHEQTRGASSSTPAPGRDRAAARGAYGFGDFPAETSHEHRARFRGASHRSAERDSRWIVGPLPSVDRNAGSRFSGPLDRGSASELQRGRLHA
jgi:endogenous inhibitor of DNA gyrase (YacG/DUF329 family)